MWYKLNTSSKKSNLFKIVMSIRRKVAKGEADLCIERTLFIFEPHEVIVDETEIKED